jgi:23S rRNA (adenine2503-C2)-methyltransferase
MWRWIYNRGATSFDVMTDITKDVRARLDRHFTLARPEVCAVEQVSTDGTRKWLLRLAPDAHGSRHEVEAVYIPEQDRGTLCISSQIGCTLTCSFCHTGTQKLVRNLTAGEIVGQVLVARDRLGEWPDDLATLPAGGRALHHQCRAHGHGRAAVQLRQRQGGHGDRRRRRRAVAVAAAHHALDVGRRARDRPGRREIGTMLAISLHATTDEVRNKLVPLNKKHPIAELLQACRDYPGLSNARRITFEYVMIKGLNDAPADAKRLVQLLKGIPAKINLIPFNPWPGTAYECSDWDTIERFAEIVNRAGYASPVRTPRGRDIMAACGQLKSDSLRPGGRERRVAASAESHV